MQQFSNRNIDNTIRLAALDYFGQIAARLRKDSVTASMSKENVATLVERLKDTDPEYAVIMEVCCNYTFSLLLTTTLSSLTKAPFHLFFFACCVV